MILQKVDGPGTIKYFESDGHALILEFSFYPMIIATNLRVLALPFMRFITALTVHPSLGRRLDEYHHFCG